MRILLHYDPDKRITVFDVLKSPAFASIVLTIRQRYPAIAEAELMDLEAYHAATISEYTTEENVAIEQAFKECWKRVKWLNEEKETEK